MANDGLPIRSGPRSEARQEPASQPPPLRPPPEGTVVIAVGETVLAGEAEAVVEKTLAQAGIPLVDENGIPGIAAFLGTDLAPEPGEIHRLLRPYAQYLVFVRVEYLGETAAGVHGPARRRFPGSGDHGARRPAGGECRCGACEASDRVHPPQRPEGGRKRAASSGLPHRPIPGREVSASQHPLTRYIMREGRVDRRCLASISGGAIGGEPI